jgi:hypothetical protein
MRVTPAVSSAPAALLVQATVQAGDDHRFLVVRAESDDFERTSGIELDGQRAPRVSTFEFRSLPAGTYEVTVVLGGASGQLASASRTVIVVPSGGR